MVLVLGPMFPLPFYCVLFTHYLKLPEVSVEGEFFFKSSVSGTVYLTCTLEGFTIGLFKIVFLQNVRGLLHCLKLLSFRNPVGHSAS